MHSRNRSVDFSVISLLILDVDGVLTDGRIHVPAEGAAGVSFHVRDGLAIQAWRASGGKVAILSGRANEGVKSRARELGIESVQTGVRDKLVGLESIKAETGLNESSMAYVGDDLPDLAPMGVCGFAVAVADAAPAVRQAAHRITRAAGGRGAVAEIIEYILRKQNRWCGEVRT